LIAAQSCHLRGLVPQKIVRFLIEFHKAMNNDTFIYRTIVLLMQQRKSDSQKLEIGGTERKINRIDQDLMLHHLGLHG